MQQKVLASFAVVLTLSGFSAFARKHKSVATAQPPVAQMPAAQKALHALNRLTFGPRPGDIEVVNQTGVDRWIGQQLHPESIAENPLLEAKLQPLDTLRMSPAELVAAYPPPQQIKAMTEGRMPYPADAETRFMLERMVARYKEKLMQKGDAAGATPISMEKTADRRSEQLENAAKLLNSDQLHVFQSGTNLEKVALFETLPLLTQLSLLDAMPQPRRQQLYAVASPGLRRRIQRFSGPLQVVNQDLSDSKLFRAIYSNRQLEEVLADFWYNHFNVYLDKGADRYLVTTYERDVIRPHVLGSFKDLLLATAQSPAMLFYLDNFQSVGPDTAPAQNANPKRAKRGLNENYGRELMELHTLGVDGGYTQQDVTEVARCFTGWTIRQPRKGGGFEFNERQHDKGEKHVLGITIPAGGGMDDGLKIIDLLAHHPATARFISKSLAVRFVSDNPPQPLVDRMAATFTRTQGDLREVMKTMLASPEFWTPDAFHAKLKSPLEMVASAIRATNADVDFGFALNRELTQLGEPLFRKQEPTGYSNKSQDWVNSAALLARMNFAMNLTANKVPGVKVDLQRFVNAQNDPMAMAHDILMTDLTPEARQTISQGLVDNNSATTKPAPIELVAGLTLGSPDFQRR